MEKKTVLIVDDHALIRTSFALAISMNPRFTVCAECGTGKEAVDLSRHFRPDLVLLDINLPDIDGIETTVQIRKFVPGTRILCISSHTNPAYAQKVMQNGARGYLTKGSSSEELFRAMTEVLNGNKFICRETKNLIAERMLNDGGKKSGAHTLTLREMQIIDLVKQGNSSKEIADQLFLSTKTIEVHRYNILKKLNLKNTAQLVSYTHQHVLV